MNLDFKLNQIEHEELLELYQKTKEFIAELDNEINTSEVEKK